MRGVAERLDDAFQKKLADNGMSCDPVPNLMEEAEEWPFNAMVTPNKPLVPMGWDYMVGPLHCLSIDTDHFSMVSPPDFDKFHVALEEGLGYCMQ